MRITIFCNTELDYDIAKSLSIKHKFEYNTQDSNIDFDIGKYLDDEIYFLSGSITGKEEHINFQKIRTKFKNIGKPINLKKYDMYDANELINSYLK